MHLACISSCPQGDTLTSTEPTPSFLVQVQQDRTQTTDPERLKRLDLVEVGLRMWSDRDSAEGVILLMASAPTVPCPSRCELEPGHPWEFFDSHGQRGQDSPAAVQRWHDRCVVVEGGEYVGVDLKRSDSLDLEGDCGEYVRYPSQVYVEPQDDGGGWTRRRPRRWSVRSPGPTGCSSRASRRVTRPTEPPARRSAPTLGQRGSGRLSWDQTHFAGFL